jgi:hypothetical protein
MVLALGELLPGHIRRVHAIIAAPEQRPGASPNEQADAAPHPVGLEVALPEVNPALASRDPGFIGCLVERAP